MPTGVADVVIIRVALKLGRHGCRIKFGDFRTNHFRDIRAAHFVMDDERRHLMFYMKIQLLATAYYRHDGPLTDSQLYLCFFFGECNI